MNRLPAVVLCAVVAASPVFSLQAPPPAAPTGDLEKGITFAREGDFEGALVELDAAVRVLREQPARTLDLVRGLVYLGVAYLELGQELSARARFREAIDLDPTLELSPREFSPQVLRVLEGVRAEAGLPPSPSPSPSPSPAGAAAPPRRVAPSPSPSPGKRRGVGLWIVGGGVAAAGAAVAVAAGGGGGAEPTTTTIPVGGVTTTTQPGTTTTTTTSTTAPAPTTTTTTLPPPPPRPSACTYTLEPANHDVPLAGTARAECNVRGSDSDCTFTFQKDADWIHFLSSTTGRGNGRMEYRVDALLLGSRTGRITVAEGGGACTVTQSGALVRPSSPTLTWSSTLDAPGARGQVVLDGGVVFQDRGRSSRSDAVGSGHHRVEATVVAGDGRPGSWAFAFEGRYVPGSLRVLAGKVVLSSDGRITFALTGRPGERVVFTFRTDE